MSIPTFYKLKLFNHCRDIGCAFEWLLLVRSLYKIYIIIIIISFCFVAWLLKCAGHAIVTVSC